MKASSELCWFYARIMVAAAGQWGNVGPCTRHASPNRPVGLVAPTWINGFLYTVTAMSVSYFCHGPAHASRCPFLLPLKWEVPIEVAIRYFCVAKCLVIPASVAEWLRCCVVGQDVERSISDHGGIILIVAECESACVLCVGCTLKGDWKKMLGWAR